MNAKGNIIVVTKKNMIAAFGDERWNTFMANLTAKDKYFKNTLIMSITVVPLEKVMIFFDEVSKEFFKNEKNLCTLYGQMGAESLLEPGGPHHAYMLTKDINLFVRNILPKIWSIFFDEGLFAATLENNVVHIKVTGIDTRSSDFEELVMAYNRQALKIFGRNSTVKRVRSMSSGDHDFYFTLELKNS